MTIDTYNCVVVFLGVPIGLGLIARLVVWMFDRADARERETAAARYESYKAELASPERKRFLADCDRIYLEHLAKLDKRPLPPKGE